MTVVLANGCFDVLHYGHVLHLEKARMYGDELVVSITMDEFVGKGPWRPYFDQYKRDLVIRALRCVAKTVLVRSSLEALELVKPNVFVKGLEYRDALLPADVEYCRKHGVEIVFTNTPTHSSTKIINDRLRQN